MDIRYSNDLSLLNEARENLEVIIDELWNYVNRKGHKTSYSRKKARKEYLAIAKQRQPKPSKISNAIGKQLRYIKKDIDAIGKMLLNTGVKVLQKNVSIVSKRFANCTANSTICTQTMFGYMKTGY